MNVCAWVHVIPTEFYARLAFRDLFYHVNSHVPVCGKFELKMKMIL